MAETKARLYKYVTPPTFSGKGGGITVKIGGKTFTQPQVGFVKNIKAINSLGATTNSIAVLVQDMNKSFKGFYAKSLGLQQGLLDSREDALKEEKKLLKKEKSEEKKAEGLAQDKKAENKQEGKGKKSSIAEKSKAIAAKSLGFFAGLASLFSGVFKSLVLYGMMDWLGDSQNIKKVKKLLEAMKSIGQFFINTYGALVKMGLNGLTKFLENPLSLEGVFGIIKFVTALGLIFAPAAVAKLGLGLFFKLAKGGGLVKGVAGFVGTLFKSVTSVFKGMFAFVKGRGLWVGGAFLATAAVAGAAGVFNEDPTDESVADLVAEKGEEETEKQLKEQLDSLNFIQKMLGKDKPIQEQINKLEGKAIGGRVPKAANGGWINGPQSGYPVSLDGGRSTSFIGHGTEWVGKRSSGGDAFVVPFDTPATRGGNGLTNMRMQQAQAGGYGLPAMSEGGEMMLHWNSGSNSGNPNGSKSRAIVQGDGNIIRSLAKKYMSGRTVSSSNGSTTTTSSGVPSASPGAGATRKEAQYKSSGAIMDFFGKSSGLLGQYAKDASPMSSGGKWAPLLNLIAGKESGGNYEAMYPSTTLPGATKMTIAQVIRQATGAVGKYQQLPRFLAERARKAGLDPNKDLYNAANQDKIIIEANLKARRAEQWLAGKVSDREFMQGLSQEFASLPNMDGRFHYSGQSSSMTPAKVLAAMKQVKKGGIPKFDPNKKYQTGDTVMKDGTQKIFDGMGWGAHDGVGATAQGTSAGTLSATTPSTGSGDTSGGDKKKPATFESVMEHIGSKMGLLGQYAKDASAMDGVTPSGKDSASDLLTSMQKKEDAATAEAKQGGGVTAATLPTQGGGGDQVAAAAPKSSGGGGQPYIIPANDYARPRFGLTSEIFNEPVSIA